MIPRRRIGDILVEAGLITPQQLDAALAEQKATKAKLGRVLVAAGVVTEDRLLDCLGHQLEIDRYTPDRYPLDLTLADLVPAGLAQQLQVVPLRRQADLLLVAMANPTDVDAIEQLERTAGLAVEPVICSETEIGQLIGGLYGTSGQFNELLDGMETPEFAAEQEEAVHEVQPEALADVASGAPVVRMVNWLISQAIRMRASDIHLTPERDFMRLRYRIDGCLRDMPSPPRAMFLPIASRIKLLSHMDIAVSRVPQDGRFTVRLNNREYNLRAATVPTVHGENVVLRLLDSQVGTRSLDSLGIGGDQVAAIQEMVQRPWGMVLVCGPTGSGKTTTLYTMLQYMNAAEKNIMTLEDPAEYRLPRVQQVQINHRAGMTFAQGLRAMLRQDPDVIMVGEIRDAETAGIAVQAALTGHLVLSTMHTNNAVGAVTRLVEMGVPAFLVSSVMLLVLSQRLVRRICPDCAAPAPAPPADVCRWLGIADPGAAVFRHGRGCNVCMNTGFLGRVGLYEVLSFDDHLRRAIAQGISAAELQEAAAARGRLRPLHLDAGSKVALGVTTAEEAGSAVMF